MDVDALTVKARGSIADQARKERRESGVEGMGESYLRIRGSALISDANRAGVRFQNRFCNRRSHAGSLYAILLIPAAVELIEDQ